MADRTSIIIEDGVKRLRTENDTLSIGYKSFDDARAYASLMVSGSANGSVNGTYTQDAAYNGVNTYVNGGLTIFYTGKIWALNTSTTDNYWDCMYTCGSQLGIYKEVAGSEELGVFGSTEDLGSGDVSGTLITSNGIFATTYLTTDILTLNQARFYFENNTNKLDIIESNSVAFLTKTDDNSTFGIPTGNRDDWAVQTFQSLLIGVNSCNVSSTNFDDTFIPCTTNADLGCTEWIYTSNFRTDGNHYTDNLTDDDSLEIAGIEHNAALGVSINTPNTIPHWGESGQAAFARDTRRFSIKYGAPSLNYPEFPDWRELGSMYDEYMDAMDYYRRYYVLNRTATISLETVNLTNNLVNPTSYSPKLISSNGSAIYPGYQIDDWLVIEPDATNYTINLGSSSLDPCLSPLDGCIYCPPYIDRNIRKVDLSDNSATNIEVADANHTNARTQGAVVADDGTIHFIHSDDEDEVIKLTLPTTLSYYGTGCSSTNQVRNFQTQINHDGMLYAIPGRYRDGKWYMRKVDPVLETVTDIELFDSTYTTPLHNTGCPYKEYVLFLAFESGTSYVAKFNTTNNAVSEVGSASQVYSGITKGFLAPDGCFYINSGAGNILRYDIDANTATVIYSGLSGGQCLTLSSSGYVYIVPTNLASTVTSFQRFKLFDVEIDPNFLCNRYLNTT